MSLVQFGAEASSVIVPRKPKEMISVSRCSDGKTRVRINFSSMDVIQNCLRKAQLLLVEKWKPENEAVATIFGSALHKALEVYYTAPLEERVLAPLETLELAAVGQGLPGAEDNLCVRAVRAFAKTGASLSMLPDTDKQSLVNGAWILHSYFKAFANDPYITYVDKEGPFVERSFTLEIHRDESLIVEIFGQIDFAFQDTLTGEIIPGDHKSTGFLNFNGSSYFDREKPSHQYTAYLLGFREVFGHDTNKFLVNILEKKAKPKGATAKGVSFPRQITERNEDDFVEFKEAMMHTVRLFLDAQKSGVWPMGPIGACTAYGSCQYRQVCSVPKSMRETLLKAKFVRA